MLCTDFDRRRPFRGWQHQSLESYLEVHMHRLCSGAWNKASSYLLWHQPFLPHWSSLTIQWGYFTSDQLRCSWHLAQLGSRLSHSNALIWNIPNWCRHQLNALTKSCLNQRVIWVSLCNERLPCCYHFCCFHSTILYEMWVGDSLRFLLLSLWKHRWLCVSVIYLTPTPRISFVCIVFSFF